MARSGTLAARLAVVGVALAAPALAFGGALLPPTLGLDTGFAPPDGVARDDLSGALTDIPSTVAVDGDRIYTIGEARDSNSNSDIAIVARRANGTMDGTFSDDGKLVLPVAADTGKDVGWSVVILPDRRLRILVQTDVSPGSTTNLDIGIVGLNPDGSFDTGFGGGDGIVTFPVGPAADTPTRLAAGPDGRLAVAGYLTDSGSKENGFVALLEADGSPVAGFGAGGVRVLDRAGPSLNDRAVDIVFRPGGGLLALFQVETNPEASANDFQAALHAFDDAGGDDPRFSGDADLVLQVGEPDTVPGGMIVHAGRVWVTGSTRVGQDTDAFLARLGPDGGGLESRRYDMRGTSIKPDQAVTSAGSDIAVVSGPPVTLVVTGSINFGSRPYWAAAAFNDLDKPLGDLGFGDLIVPTEEYGAAVGVAAGGRDWVAIAGSLVNTQQNFDTSFGTARVLIDADKTCDLAITVPRPLEIGIAPGTTAAVRARVENVGSRPCSGTLGVDDRYVLRRGGVAGPVAIGSLNPGDVAELDVDLGYVGPSALEGFVTFTVTSPDDKAVANNTARVHVLFDFCDLRLQPVSSLARMPSEGTRRLEFTVRSVGTRECLGVNLRVARGATVVGRPDLFPLRTGRSASEVISVRLARGARPGRWRGAPIEVRAHAQQAANDIDDTVAFSPTVVGVGDSDIRAVSARAVSGRSRAGKGLASRLVRVRRVEVAISRKAGKSCRWVTSTGRTRTRPCTQPLWLRAKGTTTWTLRLKRSLGRGAHVVRSRAVIRAGYPEAAFSRADRNRRSFRVR